MTKSTWLGVSLALAMAVTVQAEPLGKGVVAPKIEGAAWLENGGDAKAPTAKEFEGKVVVLEFFAFW